VALAKRLGLDEYMLTDSEGKPIKKDENESQSEFEKR